MDIQQDHQRFREIVKGRIREDFKRFVSHGEMIGKRDKEYVKIPVPHIDIPRFKYGSKQGGGVGQGNGKAGDPVQGDGDGESGAGQAGNEPGQHVYEAEVSLEELADILGEELGLPAMEPKGDKNVVVEKIKYSGLGPIGPSSLRHFKSSYKEALKRYISSGEYDPTNPIIVPIKRDMRFRQFKKILKPQANAVVIYMMDVSGSMGDEQKEIVRLESFWINAWLKKHYKGLETRFLIHDAAAKEVDEKTFFSTSESGGTLISSVYNLCKKIIDEEYPLDSWNIYPFHFSDGDNWSSEDTRYCVKLLNEDLLNKVNMFCYGQVESRYGSGQFLKDLDKEFHLDERVRLSKIEGREKIVDSIKTFLGKTNVKLKEPNATA
jgi:sporulation protein YhbH